MAIDKNSNGFTFGFAIAMVVVVGTILSVLAIALKPAQDENVKREKMQNILKAMNIEVERDAAPAEFTKSITKRIMIDFDGNQVGEASGEVDKANKEDAFNIDVKKDYKTYVKKLAGQFKGDAAGFAKAMQAEENLRFPVFVGADTDGKPVYVVPMVGTGLWGPVWGYMSFKEDGRTVYGATFDHKTETPGLGAEIKESWFSDPMKGKVITDESGQFISIKVIKGGAPADSPNGVDAITGGTITSDGVGEMLDRTLEMYANYFKKN